MTSKAAAGNEIKTDKQSKALAVLETISKRATKGMPTVGIMSAQQLAQLYLGNERYLTDDERVDALIFHEALKNAIPGFITGLGGITTLPITVPTDIAGSWVLQARMVAAIAIIYDNDLEKEAVWTTIFACMLGEQAVNAFKDTAIEVAQKLTVKEISKISGKSLTKVNQAIGTRLITKFGEKGTVNLGKLVPFIGGPISATIDFFFCYSIGLLAKSVFGPENADLSKTNLRAEVKGVLTTATKMAAKMSREAAVRQMEERRQKKDIENLVQSLQNLLEMSASRDSKAVRHRKEMILEKGPEVRECLIVHAIKGNDVFQDAAREILVELCEPEDDAITKHLNNKDEAVRVFIFSVLEGVLAKESLDAKEGLEEQ